MDVPTDKHDRRMKYSEKRRREGLFLVDDINTFAIILRIPAIRYNGTTI